MRENNYRGVVWQTTLTLPLFLFTSPKKKKKKFELFYTFYIASIIFYYYSNKKTHYKTKLFHFSISHQSLLTTIQTIIPQHNYLPNRPRVLCHSSQDALKAVLDKKIGFP